MGAAHGQLAVLKPVRTDLIQNVPQVAWTALVYDRIAPSVLVARAHEPSGWASHVVRCCPVSS